MELEAAHEIQYFQVIVAGLPPRDGQMGEGLALAVQVAEAAEQFQRLLEGGDGGRVDAGSPVHPAQPVEGIGLATLAA